MTCLVAMNHGSWICLDADTVFFLSLSSHSIPWRQRIVRRMDSHRLFWRKVFLVLTEHISLFYTLSSCHFIHELAHWSLWFPTSAHSSPGPLVYHNRYCLFSAPHRFLFLLRCIPLRFLARWPGHTISRFSPGAGWQVKVDSPLLKGQQ